MNIRKHGVFETPYLTAEILSHDIRVDYKPTCELCAAQKLAQQRNEKLKELGIDLCVSFSCSSYDEICDSPRQFYLANVNIKQFKEDRK